MVGWIYVVSWESGLIDERISMLEMFVFGKGNIIRVRCFKIGILG